jgi:hypothetical protein
VNTGKLSFTVYGPVAETAALDVLLDGGPLCVAGVWDWKDRRRVPGLYRIWFKRLGLSFGPFFASLQLADRAMRKTLKEFPAGFWGESLEWYQRQQAFHEWIDRELGKPDELVGGVWAND